MLQRYPGLFLDDLAGLFRANLPGHSTSLFCELLESFTPELAETIKSGQARGLFKSDLDSRTGSDLLKGLVNGGAFQCVMPGSDEDPTYFFDRLCEQALDLLQDDPGDFKRWAE